LVFHYMGWVTWNVPLLDRIFRSADRALMLRSLAVYVDKGQPIVAGLRSLASFYPKLWIRLRLAFATETIMQGDSWCNSLREYGLIRTNDAAVFEAAQRVGNLSWALREIADRDERRLGYRLRAAGEWLCPLILLSVAGMVYVFVSAFFSPLIKLITEMSG
jgi:general secretion pathway protein F